MGLIQKKIDYILSTCFFRVNLNYQLHQKLMKLVLQGNNDHL